MRPASILRRLAPLFLLAWMLPACATIVSGSTSTIAVESQPPGASCTVEREGGVVASVAATPGPVSVRRSMRDMAVRCAHPGYGQGTATVPARINGWVLGNLLLGGMVGIVVDAATGAMGGYPDQVSVPLQPDPRLAGQYGAMDDTALLRRVMNERIAASRFICPRTGRSSRDCAAEVAGQERERDSLGMPAQPAAPGTFYLPPVTPGMFGS